jgi:hypothetical protein
MEPMYMSEPNFQRLSDGQETTGDDPARGVWYASGEYCGYWTDDWLKLHSGGMGIPVCPHCGCPGMQIAYDKWESSAREFESDHPRYLEFLAHEKEKCTRLSTARRTFIDRYNEWLKSVENQEGGK